VLFVAGIICVLVGLPLTGLVVGFVVSFGSCFKSACSVFESSAGLTFPVAGLLLAVPLAIVMLRRLRALPRLD
jgi:tetrahydromethanopterin S-methyltransferase subunit E